MRWEVASGVGYGAIGGAASAAFSPDLLKAIDPTGAALSPGQQAAMAGFATLIGGGLAGLAGANAQGGASAAQNEVLNNTDAHPENAAKNGGVLGAVGDWLKNTYGDPVGSIENWIGQFGGLVQSGAQQKMSQSPSDLVAQGIANGVTAVSGAGGGSPTAGPDLAPAGPAGGTGQLPSPVASPNSSGNTPSNALLSNGNNGDDTGSSTAGQGPSTNNGQTPASSSIVCRGGTCLSTNFANGSGVTQNPDGTLNGVSVQSSNNGTVQTLSVPFKNGQVGTTTVGDIQAAGGTIVYDGTPYNPNHATINGLTAEQLQDLFTPTMPNPAKVGK